MAKYEDLILRLREEGMDDLADDFEAFSATSLRKKASGFDEAVAERDRLKAQLQDLVERPKKEQAFRNAGVDFDALRPLEVQQLLAMKPDDGEITEEWVAKVIVEAQLPTSGSVVANEEVPEAGKVADAAVTAPVGGSSAAVLSPEMVTKWTTDQLIRFAETNPEAWEALKRGETVKGVVP